MKALRTTLVLFSLLAAGSALAHGYKAGSIAIGHPFAVVTPPAATRGVAYLKLTNEGTQGDVLLAASGDVAERIEIHQTTVRDGVASMRPVPDGVEIAPGTAVEFAAGGYHLMLIGLKKPLVAGERVPISLRFRDAGEVQVELAVQEPKNETADPHAGH